MPAKLIVVRSLLPFFILLPWAAFSQAQPVAPGGDSLSPAQAQGLVERALGAELRTAQDQSHPMRYMLRKSSPRLATTKEIVETRDGFVARLLAVNGQPLGPADEQKEQARLSALLSDPSLQKHRKRGEDQDTAIVLKLLRMLPRAFLFQYAGAGIGPEGRVEKFTFTPNPRFDPPDFETQALTAMTGELWVDAAQERVTRLKGHLQQDTDYGWGILGKLDKGGYVLLEQQDVGARQWRITRVQLEMSLRVLFKTKIFNTTEEMSHFSPVPPATDYRQAIQMLRAGTGGSNQANR